MTTLTAAREITGKQSILFYTSLHDRRFYEPSGAFCRAPREISRSPRLAHKAPVMQASFIHMRQCMITSLGRDQGV